MTMFDRIREIFADLFFIDPATIDPDSGRGQIEKWDSLNHLLVINELEARFGVQFTSDQIVEIKTVGDIEKALVAQGVA